MTEWRQGRRALRLVGGRLASLWRGFAASGPARLLRKADSRPLVIQFVAALLLAIVVAEPLFELAKLAWTAICAIAGVEEALEPSYRALALVVAGATLLIALAFLIPLLRQKLGADEMPAAGIDSGALERTIWLLIALLLVESFTAEVFIEGARLVGLEGSTLAWVLALLLPFLLLALVLVAAATLSSAEPFFATRFENRIAEASGRPAAWPAGIIIGALSTPPEHLLKDMKGKGLQGYTNWQAPDVDGRFRLFSEPRRLAKTIAGADLDMADDFVKRFNWRQIALAYHEQIPDDPAVPERLPRLILLTSAESAPHAQAFEEFFAWLLAPFERPDLAGRLLEVHETALDFEDLGHIEDELEKVYEEACREVGAAKVVIDITGAQRPWALAAMGATLGARDRIVSYVAQKPFTRNGGDAWVRYYDLDGSRPRLRDRGKVQLGMD